MRLRQRDGSGQIPPTYGQATADAPGLDFTRAGYGSIDEVYLAVLGRDIPEAGPPTPPRFAC